MTIPTTLPNELSHILTEFNPAENSTTRSKAFLLLSAFCQGVRGTASQPSQEGSDDTTERLTRIFTPHLQPMLVSEKENELIAGISFLTALFQIDVVSASAIFKQDGILESVMDSVDLSPSPHLSLAVAHLLGQASGQKSCRAIISTQHTEWLAFATRQSKDSELRAAAAIASVKLSRGMAADHALESSTEPFGDRDVDLANMLKDLVKTNPDFSPSTIDALEGLAFVSTNPDVKEILSNDGVFLKCLFDLVSQLKAQRTTQSEHHGVLLYGISVITTNVCGRKPRLTEEQTQLEKLKRMARGGDKATKESSSNLDDDEYVEARVLRLVDSGVLGALSTLVILSESAAVRLNAARSYLSIIEEKEHRGKALQSGASKALQSIIQTGFSLQSQSKAVTLDSDYLFPIQALAKLAITSSPVQVFGPDVGLSMNAIKPFSILFLHNSSSLLQRFEAVMALTNLASQSPAVASKVANSENFMNRLELFLLEEHVLMRRAATELVCNLLGAGEDVYNRYCGPGCKAKVQLLLALSDVEDTPTRQAASGALAILTTSPEASQALIDLQTERHRAFPILTLLLRPDESDSRDHNLGLTHRAAICLANTTSNIKDSPLLRAARAEAHSSGLLEAIIRLASSSMPELIDGPLRQSLSVLIEGYAALQR